MATIASLNIGLSADSARLNRDLSKARKRTKKFSKGVSADFKRVGAAILAAVSIRAIGSFLKQLDDIAKNARSVGLSAASFQTLTGALEQMGITSATAHKSLINLQKAVGEAGIGTKTYTDALELIGLSYQQIADLSPNEQFLAVVDALRQTEDVNARALAGNRLLGRAYKDLGTVINEGASGIRNLQAELVSYGIVIGDDALEATEKFNDALDTLGRQSLANIANAFAPVIDVMGDFVIITSNVIARMGSLGTTLTRIFGGGVLVLGIGLVVSALKVMVVFIYTSLVPSLVAAIRSLYRFTLALLTNPIVLIITAIVLALGLMVTALLKWRQQVASIVGKTVAFFHRQFLNLRTLITHLFDDSGKTLEEKFAENAKAAEVSAMKVEEAVGGALDSIANKLEAIKSSAAEAWRALTSPPAGIPTNIGGPFDYLQNAGGTSGSTTSGSDNEVKEQIKSQAEIVRESYAQSVSQGIIDGFEAGGVRGALESFAKSLQDILSKRAASSLADVLFGATGSSGGGLLSGLFGAIAGVNTGGIITSSGIHRFNHGGVVPGSGNRDTVPALLTPGEVVLNPARGQGLGGDTYNITIDAIDTQSFNDRLAKDPRLVSQIAQVGYNSAKTIRR